MKNNIYELAANAASLNDNGRFFPSFTPSAAHGQICAANDANFDAAHLSEPLTEYLVDYPDEDGLQALLDAAFPAVPVGRSFSYKTHTSPDAFQADTDDADIREIGGSFAQVRRVGSYADGRTDNKGLVMILDNDQGGEDPAVQQRAVANLRNRLLRTELYRGEALLEANDTPASKNWGATNTTADPDADLLQMLDTSGDERGIDANTVLYGGAAWIYRNLAHRRATTAGGFASAGLTPDQVGQLVGARVLLSKFRYQSAAATKTKIVASKVYGYYAKAGAMPDDPSNIKRFITAVPGGGAFRVYIEPVLKRTSIAVEHYSRLVATSTLGIRQLVVTFT